MQKTLVAATLAAAFAMGSGAYAADLNAGGQRAGGQKDDWSADDIVIANNQVIAQFVTANFGYKETGDPARYSYGTLDTEKGWVPGGGVSLSLMRNWFVSNFYFNAQYSYLNGQTSYVGSNVYDLRAAPVTGLYGSVRAKDGAIVNDADFRVGKGFNLQPNFMVTPYLGVGYHDWERRVNGGEEYSNGYVGGGLLLQWAPFSGVVLSAHGLAGTTFASHIDVASYGDTSAVPARTAIYGITGFSGDLGDSAIYRVGASGDYAVTRNIHVSAGVEWVEFKYGESAIYYHYYEPNSSTRNTILKVGVGYAFGGDEYTPPLK
jgi:hypothetical protein